MPVPVTLDGHSLTIADVVAVARHGAPVAIAAAARKGIEASRRVVEEAVTRGDTIYGVNTGFGKLAHVRIPPDRIRALQLNLIRSHASGVGEPLSDRKSTRLNSSHLVISYAVFCLKKKKKKKIGR